MSPIREGEDDLVSAARQVYEEDLKPQLEAEHFGEIIAVEPRSRGYVLGKTLREVDRACRSRFQSLPVYIFRVGGGGAVKIGGAVTRGRISG